MIFAHSEVYSLIQEKVLVHKILYSPNNSGTGKLQKNARGVSAQVHNEIERESDREGKRE